MAFSPRLMLALTPSTASTTNGPIHWALNFFHRPFARSHQRGAPHLPPLALSALFSYRNPVRFWFYFLVACFSLWHAPLEFALSIRLHSHHSCIWAWVVLAGRTVPTPYDQIVAQQASTQWLGESSNFKRVA
jgi:hypothetical protein